MSRSDLRRLLDDELDALAAPMRTLEEEARRFYEHPDSPAPEAIEPLPPGSGPLRQETIHAAVGLS